MQRPVHSISGFTIVELLVALALTSFAAAGIYRTFSAQHKIYSVQDQVVEMQQNVRSSIAMLVRDIRMAGCDPRGTSGASILTATTTSINFTRDTIGRESDSLDNDNDGETDEADERDSDGDCNDTDENITYTFASPNLSRNGQPAAQNIQNLEFFYTFTDSTAPTTTPTAADLTKIRNVQITLLARTGSQHKDFRDTRTYTTPSGAVWGPFNDNIRRRFFTTTVVRRNANTGH